MNRQAQRVHGLGTTVFAEMSALAASTGAINLGQGFPDTDGPAEVAQAAIAAIRDGRNQYPHGSGVPELRHAVAAYRARFTGQEYDPDGEVLITTGATEAIAAALLGLIDPGDEVAVLEPYYDSYVACIGFAGGHRRPVTLRPPSYALDVESLRAAITSRTKVLLVNSPHNPTGAVLSRDELTALAEVAIEHDLVVIADEVYEHMAFDSERPHIPIATLPGMRERTISIGSAGKTFSFTGWKVGWVTGPRDLVECVRLSKQFLTYVSGAPLQPAVAVGLALPDTYFAELRRSLAAKRDLLCDGLSAAGLDVHRPHGTYFATTDVRSVGYDDGWEFCRDLPARAGVVAVPHAPFWDDHEAGRPLVRWAFCKKDEVLNEVVRRLSAVRHSTTGAW
jgi:N-succinyldiaminopimelate aminotransferase